MDSRYVHDVRPRNFHCLLNDLFGNAIMLYRTVHLYDCLIHLRRNNYHDLICDVRDSTHTCGTCANRRIGTSTTLSMYCTSERCIIISRLLVRHNNDVVDVYRCTETAVPPRFSAPSEPAAPNVAQRRDQPCQEHTCNLHTFLKHSGFPLCYNRSARSVDLTLEHGCLLYHLDKLNLLHDRTDVNNLCTVRLTHLNCLLNCLGCRKLCLC